jgi:hypothetical protein
MSPGALLVFVSRFLSDHEILPNRVQGQVRPSALCRSNAPLQIVNLARFSGALSWNYAAYTDHRNIGAEVSVDEHDLYLGRIATFRTWFDREIMASGNHSNPDAIVILPYGDAEPRYRDARSESVHLSLRPLWREWVILTQSSNPTAKESIDATLLSPILGTPHLVAPCESTQADTRRKSVMQADVGSPQLPKCRIVLVSAAGPSTSRYLSPSWAPEVLERPLTHIDLKLIY